MSYIAPQSSLELDVVRASGYSTYWMNLFSAALLLLGSVGFIAYCAASETETKQVSGAVQKLSDQQLGQVDLTKEPYLSGKLEANDIESLLRDKFKLPTATDGPDRPTIIHILQWTDSTHTTVNFQQWYVWNPRTSKLGGFYFQTAQKMFEGTLIPGETSFRIVYIHLSPKQGAGPNLANIDDSIDANGLLKHSVSYKVEITKQPSQFLQDVKTALGILGVTTGGPVAAGVPVDVGYWGWGDITSQYSTSTLKITPTVDDKSGATTVTTTAHTGDLPAARTYTNESPTYVALGVAVPVKNYSEIEYQTSDNAVTSKSVDKKTAFMTLDAYYPAALPGLMTFRYIPHPFIGLPLTGKTLDHPMIGLAIGMPWFQFFAGEVFNREPGIPGQPTGKSKQFVWGIKISVTAAATAWKSTSK